VSVSAHGSGCSPLSVRLNIHHAALKRCHQIIKEPVDWLFHKFRAKISRGEVPAFSRLIEAFWLRSTLLLGDFVISHFDLLFGVFIKTFSMVRQPLTLTNWALRGDHDGHPDG
jgi:hypothetical protein